MEVQMTISPEAERFILEHKLRGPNGEAMVIQLFGMLDDNPLRNVPFSSFLGALKSGEVLAAEMTGKELFKWTVGANYLSAVAPSDIRYVQGIPFELTERQISMIGNRRLVLVDECLRFVPDLPPFRPADLM